MKPIMNSGVVVFCLLATLGAAQPEGVEAPALSEPVRRALALAGNAEREGRFDTAALNYVMAHALNPDAPGARAALERFAGRIVLTQRDRDEAAPVRPDPLDEIRRERQRREELESAVSLMERSLRSVSDRLDRVDRELDDQFRAEPLAQRLTREIEELERTVRDQQREIDRMNREIDRLWSRVGR